MKQNFNLRIALLGAGKFGVVLAPYINEFAELVAICDSSAASRTSFASASGLCLPEFDDFARLLKEIEVDAVVISTPHHTHRQIAVQAAEAGKHVYCEKPMANTVCECWEMVQACSEAGVRLMVGHKRRLRPPWARMIKLREHLGPVVAIHVCAYFDSRPYDHRGWWTRSEQSGGILSLNGVHHVDWMRAMAGEVSTVRALAAPQIEPRYDFADTLHVALKFQSGAIGTLDVSLSYPLFVFRETGGPLVICKDGGIRFVPFQDHIDLYWQHRNDQEAHCERFDDLGFDHAYRQELSDFVRWITEGTQPCLTWQEGLRCVEVMEAARRSAQQQGAEIRLPLYPEMEFLTDRCLGTTPQAKAKL